MSFTSQTSYERVFNPSLHTDESIQLRQHFTSKIESKRGVLKETLHTSQLAAVIFGSAEVGVAISDETADAFGLKHSDIDVSILYASGKVISPMSYESLFPSRSYESDRDQLVNLVNNVVDDDKISIHEVISIEEIFAHLDYIEQHISEITLINETFFNLYLTAFLISPSIVGDSEFIKESKIDIINKIQGMGVVGKKLWDTLSFTFSKHYSHYGNNVDIYDSSQATKRKQKALLAIRELRERKRRNRGSIGQESKRINQKRGFVGWLVSSIESWKADIFRNIPSNKNVFEHERNVLRRLQRFKNDVQLPELENAMELVK